MRAERSCCCWRRWWPHAANDFYVARRVHVQTLAKVVLYAQVVVNAFLLAAVLLLAQYVLAPVLALSLLGGVALFAAIRLRQKLLVLPHIGICWGVVAGGVYLCCKLCAAFERARAAFAAALPAYCAGDGRALFAVCLTLGALYVLLTLVAGVLDLAEFAYLARLGRATVTPAATPPPAPATPPPAPATPPLPQPTPVYFLPYSSYRQFNENGLHMKLAERRAPPPDHRPLPGHRYVPALSGYHEPKPYPWRIQEENDDTSTTASAQ